MPVLAGATRAPASRRSFLARASALTLAIPGVGAALAACGPGSGARADSARGCAAGTAPNGSERSQPHNFDSRLDSTVLDSGHHGGTSATGAATKGVQQAAYQRYDPAPPPTPAARRLHPQWHTRQTPIRISDETVVAAWTFEGDIPGPIVHCRVGDTVDFTLTNDAQVPHSMDFRAAQLDPRQAFR